MKLPEQSWWPLLDDKTKRRVTIASEWPNITRRQAVQDAWQVSAATAKRDLSAVRQVMGGKRGIRY